MLVFCVQHSKPARFCILDKAGYAFVWPLKLGNVVTVSQNLNASNISALSRPKAHAKNIVQETHVLMELVALITLSSSAWQKVSNLRGCMA